MKWEQISIMIPKFSLYSLETGKSSYQHLKIDSRTVPRPYISPTYLHCRPPPPHFFFAVFSKISGKCLVGELSIWEFSRGTVLWEISVWEMSIGEMSGYP